MVVLRKFMRHTANRQGESNILSSNSNMIHSFMEYLDAKQIAEKIMYLVFLFTPKSLGLDTSKDTIYDNKYTVILSVNIPKGNTTVRYFNIAM